MTRWIDIQRQRRWRDARPVLAKWRAWAIRALRMIACAAVGAWFGYWLARAF